VRANCSRFGTPWHPSNGCSALFVTKRAVNGYYQTLDYAYWQRRGDLARLVPLAEMQIKSAESRSRLRTKSFAGNSNRARFTGGRLDRPRRDNKSGNHVPMADRIGVDAKLIGKGFPKRLATLGVRMANTVQPGKTYLGWRERTDFHRSDAAN